LPSLKTATNRAIAPQSDEFNVANLLIGADLPPICETFAPGRQSEFKGRAKAALKLPFIARADFAFFSWWSGGVGGDSPQK
jgi:hypothetical protein